MSPLGKVAQKSWHFDVSERKPVLKSHRKKEFRAHKTNFTFDFSGSKGFTDLNAGD